MALNNKRRVIDPKKLRKRSDIERDHGIPILVQGERVPTDTGYRVYSFQGLFDMFYEYMVKGTSTPTMVNPKKDKVIHIVAGQGFVLTQAPTGTEEQHRVRAGSVIPLRRGIVYRVATADAHLEFFSSCAAKYDETTEFLDTDVAEFRDVPPELLREPPVEAFEPAQRRGSKAVQQLAAQRGDRARTQNDATPEIDNATVRPGFNARPSGGRFDESGAG